MRAFGQGERREGFEQRAALLTGGRVWGWGWRLGVGGWGWLVSEHTICGKESGEGLSRGANCRGLIAISDCYLIVVA